MRRGTILLLALIFAIALAATAYAVPLLVELKIGDPLTAVVSSPPVLNEEVSVPSSSPGKGNGKSGDKGSSGTKTNNGNGSSGDKGNSGKKDDPLSNANLKSLTLWLSTDGKSWKALDAEVTNVGDDKITAKFNSKGNGTLDPVALGLPEATTSSVDFSSYYIGVSTSSTSFTGTTYTSRLLSWNVATKADQVVTSVPEPVLWPLIAMGAAGAGFALRRRKKS